MNLPLDNSERMDKCQLSKSNLQHVSVLAPVSYWKQPHDEPLSGESSKLVHEYLKTITDQIMQKGRKFQITKNVSYLDSALNDKFEERKANVFVVVISNESEQKECLTDRSQEGNQPKKETNAFHPTIQRMQRAKEYSDSIRLQRLQHLRSSQNEEKTKEVMGGSLAAQQTEKSEQDQSLNETSTSSHQKAQFVSLRQRNQDHSRQQKIIAKVTSRSQSSTQKSPAPHFNKASDETRASSSSRENSAIIPVQKALTTDYPMTKILIHHVYPNNHQNHPVNLMFNFYNQVVQASFKAKGGKMNVPLI